MNLSQKLVGLGLATAVAFGGATLIAPHEGLVLETYTDSGGVLTACFGHTGAELSQGQTFSLEQCIELFAEDLAESDLHLRRLTHPVILTPGERFAYLSLIYNIGPGLFATSTLRKKLLSGDRVGACYELTQACGRYGCHGFVFDNGVMLSGLVKRRHKELKVCLKDVVNVDKTVFKWEWVSPVCNRFSVHDPSWFGYRAQIQSGRSCY